MKYSNPENVHKVKNENIPIGPTLRIKYSVVIAPIGLTNVNQRLAIAEAESTHVS